MRIHSSLKSGILFVWLATKVAYTYNEIHWGCYGKIYIDWSRNCTKWRVLANQRSYVLCYRTSRYHNQLWHCNFYRYVSFSSVRISEFLILITCLLQEYPGDRVNNKHILFYRLHFIVKDARPECNGCSSCCIGSTERAYAIRSSILCMLIVLLFFIATWMFGSDSGAAFAQSCLRPNDAYTEMFEKWWVFSSIVTMINILGIVLCASLYTWLKREECDTTLITTKVYKLHAIFTL